MVGYRARTQVRDHDGRTRPVERSGKTKGAATNRLKEHLRDRVRLDVGDGDITPDSTVELLVKTWFKNGVKDELWVDTTKQQYERVMDVHVIPGLGGLAVYQLTVGRSRGFLDKVKSKHGASTARMARSVLSGAASLACQHGALPQNPIREIPAIKVDSAPVTAFTVDEVRSLRRDIRLNKRACRRDLPDLVDFMLATSLRIGEALAFEWTDIDLEAGTCTVVANVHRIKDKGLLRNIYPNNKLKRRTLRLPAWAIEMLRARHTAMSDATLVFPAVASGTLRDPSNIGADLRDAFADVGISNAKSHMFRKTGFEPHGLTLAARHATSPTSSATTRSTWPRSATSCVTPRRPAPQRYLSS